MKILVLALTLVALACSSSSPTTTSNGGTGGTVATSAGTGGATSAGGASAGSPSGGAGAGGASAGGAGGIGMAGTGGTATCVKCPATCCDAGALCVDDGLGNLSCKKPCTTNSQCPMSAPCCQVLKDGSGACAADSGGSLLCRCTTGAECTSKSCAPGQDAMGNPVGPYICVPNDGMPYDGCHGLTTCGNGYCCFTDAKGNEFCASQCTNDSMCGAASCVTYSNANTTCGGMLGCGPK
jgi:hypothetical protein